MMSGGKSMEGGEGERRERQRKGGERGRRKRWKREIEKYRMTA